MLKKGGIFLCLSLCSVLAFAQDNTAEMFRTDNPNLINLGEVKTYSGAPVVYIQGVQPPEKANNAMEALQLKFFGTKNISDVTKDTLQLTETAPETSSENQIQNLTFETPFHKAVQAAFVHHISSFIAIVHVVNQNKIVVNENITVVNTDQDLFWVREIPLVPGANASITRYIQNGQPLAVNTSPQTDALTLTAPIPLDVGSNQIALTYQIENPLQKEGLDLDLTGTSLGWPIAQFKAVFFFPLPQTLQAGKLVFGTNQLDIPNIYTQQTDAEAKSAAFQINRIVPPNASIHAQLQLDSAKLPNEQGQSVSSTALWSGLILLIVYWIAFVLWDKYFPKKTRLAQIKQPQNPMLFSTQTGIKLTDNVWNELADFYTGINQSTEDLKKQQSKWKHHYLFEKFKANTQNFFLLTFELMIGTILLLAGIWGTIFYIAQQITLSAILSSLLLALLAWVLLYIFILKPTQQAFWHKRLTMLFSDAVLSGLTVQQIDQIYPLFILTQQGEKWREKLVQINPKSAQNAHLL